MKRRDGFTLIELLVVIAIIGILAGLVLASLQAVRQKANATATESLIQALSIACDQYYQDWGGMYPPAFQNESPTRNEGIEMLYAGLTTREGRSTRDYAKDISRDSLGDVDSDSAREFIDAWGNPLVYVDSMNYDKHCEYVTETGQTFTAEPQRDPEDNRWYRPGKFMIWSVGRYGENHNGLEDNISNF